jgi:hypothetical protein
VSEDLVVAEREVVRLAQLPVEALDECQRDTEQEAPRLLLVIGEPARHVHCVSLSQWLK